MTPSSWSTGVLIGALTGVLTAGLAGCGGGERKEWDSEQEAWESVRPTRYRFDYTVTGAAPGRGPWRIEVDGDQAVSVAYVGQGAVPTPGLTAATAPTVEKLFERVAQQLDQPAVQVEVRYDPHWHHPMEAYFDAGEEGDGFKAEALTPLD